MPPIIIIAGPTGVGKTDLALELAQLINGEIISADSRQIYKYFDLGTAKPSLEKRKIIAHHLLDLIEPGEDFSAGDFKELSQKIIAELLIRKKTPLVVGGTGLYLKTLTENLNCGVKSDPEVRKKIDKEIKEKGVPAIYAKLKEIDPLAAKRIHPRDRIRIVRAWEVYLISGRPFSEFIGSPAQKRYDFLYFVLEREREKLYQRLNKRVERILSAGWIDEVRKLLRQGYDPETKPFLSLGYKSIIKHLRGMITYEETVEEIKKQTRQYAKRQLTWFRKVKDAIRVEINEAETAKQSALRLLQFIAGRDKS